MSQQLIDVMTLIAATGLFCIAGHWMNRRAG